MSSIIDTPVTFSLPDLRYRLSCRQTLTGMEFYALR